MLADVVIVGQAPANRPLRDLDMGCQHSPIEDSVAQARSQRDDHFEATARNRSRAGNLGVIEHLRRQSESLFDRPAHIEMVPAFHQLGQHARTRPVAGDVVGSRDNDAMSDHARHAHRHSRRRGKLAREADNGFHEELGGQRVRGRNPARRGHHRAPLIHDGTLDTTATAVDRQRHLTSHGIRLPDTARAGHSVRNVRPNARVDQ